MGLAVRILIGAVVVIGVAAGAALWGLILVNQAGPLETDTAVVIPKGSGLEAISLVLSDADVIDRPFLFATTAKSRLPTGR